MINSMFTSAYSIEDYNNKMKAIETLGKIVVSVLAKGHWCEDTKKQADENRENFNYSKSVGSSYGDFSDDDKMLFSDPVISVEKIWVTLENNRKVRFPNSPSKTNEADPARIFITFED